jgi:hypothetical protein
MDRPAQRPRIEVAGWAVKGASRAGKRGGETGDLNAFKRQSGVKVTQVVHIARDDDGPLASSDEDNRGVDDVGSAGAPTKEACGLGEHLVKRRHDRGRPLHQSAERPLAGCTSPGLAQYPRRDYQPRPALECLADESTHMPIPTFESDKGTRI